MHLLYTLFDTPLGGLEALFSIHGLCFLAFQEGSHPDPIIAAPVSPVLPKIPRQIAKAYSNATIQPFSENSTTLPDFLSLQQWLKVYLNTPDKVASEAPVPRLDLQGTPFEHSVWAASQSVSNGERKSYGWIANQILNPKAVRAVGRALKENPIALIVPCHRIVGSNASLTGYRGELWRKQWLLDHESPPSR